MSNFGVKPIDVTVEKLEKIAKMDVNELSVNETSDNSSLPTSKVVHEAIVGETTKFLPLEAETEWIFDGGNSESDINIEFKIDEEVSNSSKNAIQNKAIKNYVDEKNQLLNQKIKGLEEKNEELANFVVEQGEIDGWQCRKWSNGDAECWREYTQDVETNNVWTEILYYGEINTINFPENLFISRPVLDVTAEEFAGGNAFFTKKYTTTENTGQIFIISPNNDKIGIRLNLMAKGRWM